jgi:hypothetical protein
MVPYLRRLKRRNRALQSRKRDDDDDVDDDVDDYVDDVTCDKINSYTIEEL